MLRFRREREQNRVLVSEGLSDSLPEVVKVEVKPQPSHLEEEFHLACLELLYRGAAIRWRIATEQGRIQKLSWGSLEDAMPRWWFVPRKA
jgi:hypothetical protein